MTEKVDGEIGRLLCALKDSGKWEDTVIIFTSDHGDMDAAHKMEHKTALYQECCKVPLIIKGISGPENEVSSSLTVNGLDLICTVMDYAGIEKPDHLEGISLKREAEGESDGTSERKERECVHREACYWSRSEQ